MPDPGLVCDGLDVSEANGPVLWSEVRKAGLRFAYVKANTGEGVADRLLHDHADGCDREGLLWGPYQFGLADNDPLDDVDALAKALKGRFFDLRPALDLETRNGLPAPKVLDWALGWGERAKVVWGRNPCLYFGLNFWRTLLREQPAYGPQFAPWTPWVAAYSNTFSQIQTAPWGPVGLRQWRGNTIWTDGNYGPRPKTKGATVVVLPGRVPGVATECDLNRYVGSYDDLKRDHGLAVALPTLAG